MSLLALDRVTKRYSTGRHEYTGLRHTSLDLAAGEMVAVWGIRRSGRTTLLRVAAGLEAPDEGRVLFRGEDLASHRGFLGNEIGYVNTHFMQTQGATAVEQVAVGLLAKGMPMTAARRRSYDALTRVDAAHCAELDTRLLDLAEHVRVGLARALVTGPRLLLLDDPTNGVDLLQRDPLLELIRSIADDGVGVLLTASEVVDIAHRLLSIDSGELRGNATPQAASVVPIRPAERSA